MIERLSKAIFEAADEGYLCPDLQAIQDITRPVAWPEFMRLARKYLDVYLDDLQEAPNNEDRNWWPVHLEHEGGVLYLHVEGYDNVEDGQVAALEAYDGGLQLLVWGDFTSPEPTHVLSLEGARPQKKVDKRVEHPAGPLAVEDAPYTIDRRDPCGLCLEEWDGRPAHAALCNAEIGSTWVHQACYEEVFQ